MHQVCWCGSHWRWCLMVGGKQKQRLTQTEPARPHELVPVPATALSAAACKWSLCQKGYLPPDAWAEALAPASCPPQSPLVNRCYYDRCRVVRGLTQQFLTGAASAAATSSSGSPSLPPQVVFLGGGLDSYPLLLAQQHQPGPSSPVVAVVDLPEVLEERRSRLERAGSVTGGEVRCVGADLRDLGALGRALLSPVQQQGAGLDPRAATFFVLESVVGYLQQQETRALLRWLATSWCCSASAAVLVLDQLVEEGDALGRAVASGFGARGCPLMGLSDDWRAGLRGACAALRRAGWGHAWALDLGRAVQLVERRGGGRGEGHQEAAEPFDEQAALHHFQRQYVVAVGWCGGQAASASAGTGRGLIDLTTLAASAAQPDYEVQEALVTALEARVAALEEERQEGEEVEVRRLGRGEGSRVWSQVRRLFVEGVRPLAEESAAVQRMARDALLGPDLREGGEDGEEGRLMMWVAERGGWVLGCVGLEMRSGEEVEVKRLSVRATARRRGLGKRLLEAVEGEARARGVALVRAVTVEGMVAARALYEAYGYQPQEQQQRQGQGVARLVTLVKRL